MPADWNAVRTEFPVLAEWTYFNTATFGPVPRRAVQAATHALERRSAGASYDPVAFFDDVDIVRDKAARLLGAQADDIAFIPSAGIGLSWILNGLDWAEGDRILSFEHEFPNNQYAPLRLADRGVVLDQAPAGESFALDDFVGRITPRTRIVLTSALSYSTGFRPPLADIGAAVRDSDALFVVDGTQGVGAIPLDVAAVAADVVLVHAYKWLLSPTGAGFAFIGPQAREHLRPSVVSWRSHRDWREVTKLRDGAPELPDEAARYEGGILNFSGLAALGAVLDLYDELGLDAVYARTAAISGCVRDAVRQAGGIPLADLSPWFDGPIVAARLPGWNVADLAARLHRNKIVAAARKGSLRVSPHFFNNEQDVESLAAALREFSQNT